MKTSAGLLVYRKRDGRIEVLLGRMGGPWFRNKEKGAWSIPKGEYTEGEDPLDTAKREFHEELGLRAPAGELIELGEINQSNNKKVIAWAVEGDLDVRHTVSNKAKGEWPPGSGKIMEWPEIEKADWMTPEEAAKKLISAQVEYLLRLAAALNYNFKPATEPSQEKLL